MKFSPKPFILGLMITGGIALTAAGTRQLSGYVSSITVGEFTLMPPGFSLILIGSAISLFALGYTVGEMMFERKNES